MSSLRATSGDSPADEATSVVVVRGLVAQPRSFTREDLAALPQSTRTATFVSRGGERTATYTGPSLLDVVHAAGGILEEQRLDRLRTYVVARSATGYEVVFSWGEIDASFGDGDYLLAHESDDAPSAAGTGAIRLVVPNDHHGGRYVGQLIELEVCAIPRPRSA